VSYELDPDPYNGYFNGDGDARYLLYASGTPNGNQSWFQIRLKVQNYYDPNTPLWNYLYAPAGGESHTASSDNQAPWDWNQ
jgi:hypothetical protein